MRALCLLIVSALLGGCAARAVRCDGRLEPVNTPVAAAAPASRPAADGGR